MREETEEGRKRDKQRQGGEKDWRAESMRVRKSLRCMGDMERDRESRLSWPTLHKERTASLKVTLKHTFAEKLSHLNLAELAVCTCRTVRCGVGVCRYQMTCNPSCLSSMCLSLFFLYTHTHKHASPPYQNLCAGQQILEFFTHYRFIYATFLLQLLLQRTRYSWTLISWRLTLTLEGNL